MRIWGDADACPGEIKKLLFRAAKRTKTKVTLVANQPLRTPRCEFVDSLTASRAALPAFLREAGYCTIHVGKAHFGAVGAPGSDPRNIGFEISMGGHAAGGPGSFLGTQNFSAAWRNGDRVWDVPHLEPYHGKEVFLTEALTIEANKAVDQAVAAGRPFFLYMAHYAVHVPFAVDPRFYEPYRDAGLDHTESMYAAMVEGNHEDRRYELFNLAQDLGEQTNLADKQPDIRDRLAAELRRYLAAIEAQMPIVKSTGEAVPYPDTCERRGEGN